MSEVEFLGARLEKDVIKMVEQTAEEERVDKTKALKELILLGRKQFLIKKNIEMYRTGQCSIDKAAQATGITINEMMSEAVKAGIKSTETIEEYREGLKLLK
jgi:predicted HTH domain antitoxin